MARLEIPALYRLDIGSTNWGWHKMEDLTTAINALLARSPLDPITTEQIGEEYAYFNGVGLFAWSDENDIWFVEPHKVPWLKENLFVPARWGIRVIEQIKLQIAAC